MKRMMILVAALLLGSSLSMHAGDKPELPWQSMEKGMAKAKQSHKKVMVDVYTTWCKWCKKLDEDVYSNDKVADYLSHHYVVVKLNAESPNELTFQVKKTTERDLAGAFGVSGYPTILFFDSEGKPINSLGGYVSADKFLPIIKFIGEDYYKTMSWDDFQKKQGS